MSDALRQYIDEVFSSTEIIHLFATVFDYNIPSMIVLEKCGFTRVGIMHRCIIKNGVVADLHYYELLK